MKLAPRRSILCLLLLALLGSPSSRTFAQSAPLDLWSSNTQLIIRDKSTLNYSITARIGYFEVYFDSNNNATWADAVAPYAIHTGGKIRIHGYLASPMIGGPYPAIVIGHGHHGSGNPNEAMLLAALGYVALSIDGPGQGLSTGPPDTEQGRISVEKIMNVPAPYVSYYYTRNGLQSGLDYLNTISNFCTDPTLTTFLNDFDPIAYAPTQHGPLLTIIGTHDQYFTVPAINSTYDRIASAGTSARFLKRIMMKPNVKHGVETNGNLYTYTSLYDVIQVIDSWFKYCFKNGPLPPGTPTVRMEAKPTTMVFHVTAPAGGSAINQVKLYYASQIDTRPSTVYDFGYISLSWNGLEYVGTIPLGKLPPAGPPVTPNNIIYLASVKDGANYTVTSKLYYRSGVMAFGQGFLPIIDHYYGDTLPVPPPPYCP